MNRNRTENARSFRKQPTSSEDAVWQFLRDRRFAGLKFRRQHAIGQFVADFYCPELRLVLEIDGEVHDGPESEEKDRLRDDWMVARNYRIIRIKLRDLDFEGLSRRILDIADVPPLP